MTRLEHLAVLGLSAIIEGVAMTAVFAAVFTWCVIGSGR